MASDLGEGEAERRGRLVASGRRAVEPEPVRHHVRVGRRQQQLRLAACGISDPSFLSRDASGWRVSLHAGVVTPTVRRSVGVIRGCANGRLWNRRPVI